MELKIRGMIIQGDLNCQEKIYLLSKKITKHYYKCQYYEEIWAMGRGKLRGGSDEQ
jgi:hypothetical protein